MAQRKEIKCGFNCCWKQGASQKISQNKQNLEKVKVISFDHKEWNEIKRLTPKVKVIDEFWKECGRQVKTAQHGLSRLTKTNERLYYKFDCGHETLVRNVIKNDRIRKIADCPDCGAEKYENNKNSLKSL